MRQFLLADKDDLYEKAPCDFGAIAEDLGSGPPTGLLGPRAQRRLTNRIG